jgi:hypothetical protein
MHSDWGDLMLHPERIIDRAVAPFLDPSSAVLVTGFWRSGTTWLQQILAGGLRAKSVFEPFYHRLEEYRNTLVGGFSPLYSSSEYLAMLMPYSESRIDSSLPMYRYLRTALTGGTPSSWVRRVRFRRRGIEGRHGRGRYRDALERIKDAFRRRVVVKSVRSHLLVSAIQQTFNPLTVHIWRDPRSIVASFHRKGWMEQKWVNELSLVNQLLRPADGRGAFFERWEGTIRRYEEKSATHRLAAYWSLCEKFLVGANEHSRITEVSYRQIYLKGSTLLERTLPLNFQADPSPYAQASSALSEQQTKKERLERWREMDDGQIKAVESVCQDFGMGHRMK